MSDIDAVRDDAWWDARCQEDWDDQDDPDILGDWEEEKESCA